MPELPPITTTVCPSSAGSRWIGEGIVTVLIVPLIRLVYFPIRGGKVQFDYFGISGERIRANNKGVVFHPQDLNSPTQSGGFESLLS
jgi:hypothetical protein